MSPPRVDVTAHVVEALAFAPDCVPFDAFFGEWLFSRILFDATP